MMNVTLSTFRGLLSLRQGDFQNAIKYVDYASKNLYLCEIQLHLFPPVLSQLTMMNIRLGKQENLNTVNIQSFFFFFPFSNPIII